MQGASWMGILRSIPVEQHEKLVLITVDGTEINLAGVLREERDYLLIRGRLAASTEAGRVFFIPYDQINYLAFRDGMKEAEVLAMLAQTPAPAGDVPRAALAPADTAQAAPDKDTDSEPADAAATRAPNGLTTQLNRGPQTAKAALLERLRRSRGQEAAKTPPK
ncbi:MAG TPA: hypothetical protein VG013_16450 [Gemmataceae bacterium]|jgi:hypothetical protein|nr:hypothetical protein [Gemmataceae bacterium]